MFFLSDDPLFSDEELLLMCAASGGKTVEDTATGNPLTFTTDIAKPLKSLLIPFTPVQSGTGDPSPQNIRSIVPWNGLKVWQNGKDVPISWDVESDGKYIGVDGTIGESTNFHYSDLLPVKNGFYRYTFTVSGATTTRNTRIHGYNSSGEWVEQLAYETTENGTYSIDFNVHDGVSYVRISNIKWATNESVINVTETDIPFASPVYGGTLDVVSGVLTVMYKIHRLTENDNLRQYGTYTGGIRLISDVLDDAKDYGTNSISNIAKKIYSPPSTIDALSFSIFNGASKLAIFVPDTLIDGGATVQGFNEWLTENEFLICAELATPYTVTLTPAQITALVGDNTIWSDADGSMTAVYLKKG